MYESNRRLGRKKFGNDSAGYLADSYGPVATAERKTLNDDYDGPGDSRYCRGSSDLDQTLTIWPAGDT